MPDTFVVMSKNPETNLFEVLCKIYRNDYQVDWTYETYSCGRLVRRTKLKDNPIWGMDNNQMMAWCRQQFGNRWFRIQCPRFVKKYPGKKQFMSVTQGMSNPENIGHKKREKEIEEFLEE